MSEVTEREENDLLKQIADDLKVNIDVLEERLEMVQVIPDTCCVVNLQCLGGGG